MKLGRFEIAHFVEQTFRLDGGTMFGVVPKSMWNGLVEADENNLIPMVTNLFVLKAHDKTMIFDVGLGDTLSKREKKVYGTGGVSSLDSGLSSVGLTTDDVDSVFLTHLHTDHAGGVVKREEGQYAPRFENAVYIVSKKEWQSATNPNERTAAVYAPERLHPLKEAGQLELIDGTTELLPGIRAVHTGGHTEGHLALEIESEGEKLFYYADIFPMTYHLRVPFVSATDIRPLESMNVKRGVLKSLVGKDVIMAFDHDIEVPFARVVEEGNRLIARPVLERVVE